MNARPVHLFKTRLAHLDQSLPGKKASQNIWDLWISIWQAVEIGYNALQKINTQLFSDTDALSIESFSISYERKKNLGRSMNPDILFL